MKSASLDDVYAALTTLEGLSGWWATDTKAQTEVGGILEFPASGTCSSRPHRRPS
jgi:uncharacterized protein YndB with AHSA1/START domain